MKRKGLTLIEILLSVAIISVSAIMIVKVFVAANVMNERTRDHDAAVFHAVSIMEEIDYGDIDFLFSEMHDITRFGFLEGFRPPKKDGSAWIMEKEVEKGMYAGLRLDVNDAVLTVEIDIRREQSIYRLTRNFYRRTK